MKTLTCRLHHQRRLVQPPKTKHSDLLKVMSSWPSAAKTKQKEQHSEDTKNKLTAEDGGWWIFSFADLTVQHWVEIGCLQLGTHCYHRVHSTKREEGFLFGTYQQWPLLLFEKLCPRCCCLDGGWSGGVRFMFSRSRYGGGARVDNGTYPCRTPE